MGSWGESIGDRTLTVHLTVKRCTENDVHGRTCRHGSAKSRARHPPGVEEPVELVRWQDLLLEAELSHGLAGRGRLARDRGRRVVADARVEGGHEREALLDEGGRALLVG